MPTNLVSWFLISLVAGIGWSIGCLLVAKIDGLFSRRPVS